MIARYQKYGVIDNLLRIKQGETYEPGCTDTFFYVVHDNINTAVYFLTAIASLMMRQFMYKIHNRFFNLDEKAVDELTQKYLSNYKLLITVFNFTPWLALVIIK